MIDQALQAEPSVTALGLLLLICMGTLTWVLPREKALFPLLITTCYIPLGQTFVFAGLHFQFFRIVLLIGWLRIWIRGEAVGLRLSAVDKLFVLWGATTLVMGFFTNPSLDRLVNRGGELYNALGSYFLVRCWVRNLGDLTGSLKFLAVMISPLAVSMMVEKFTSRNIFAVLGGVPEITFIREGKLRCQGAFRHPILAGTYAATLFPLLVGLWFTGRQHRRVAFLGIGCAIIATVAAASSGALLALIGVGVGFSLWPLRYRMRWFRWGVVILLMALGVAMTPPVWYLIAKISDITGGTGWHRSYLIDMAVEHFDEWWLAGSTYTAHWAPAGIVLPNDPNNMDITNHYIAEGLAGGILKLGLFLALIVKCFKTVGQSMRLPESAALPRGMLIWSVGVCLSAHCLSFISVSYFDQIVVMWYWLLAIVSILALECEISSQTSEGFQSAAGLGNASLPPSHQPAPDSPPGSHLDPPLPVATPQRAATQKSA